MVLTKEDAKKTGPPGSDTTGHDLLILSSDVGFTRGSLPLDLFFDQMMSDDAHIVPPGHPQSMTA